MSDNLSRLTRVLGMMGSQFDNEVLSAARMAEKIRRDMDKSWAVLLSEQPARDDSGLLLRCLRAEGNLFRAEGRAIRAETRASALEDRVASLEATIRAMQAANTSKPEADATARRSRPRSTAMPPRYRLDPMVMAELVTALKNGWCSSYKVYDITKWPHANLRLRLSQIAEQRDLKLKTMPARYGKGFIYRFE